MTRRFALLLSFVFVAACASPSSENAPPEGAPPASAPSAPIGQSADATVSPKVTPSPTSDDGTGSRVDGGALVPTTTPSAEGVAPGAYGASPVARGERVDGSACTRGDECASGVCEGQGCGVDEGRCVAPSRPCTRDLRPFCGCDGQTFRASGTCPKRTFAHEGMCTPPR